MNESIIMIYQLSKNKNTLNAAVNGMLYLFASTFDYKEVFIWTKTYWILDFFYCYSDSTHDSLSAGMFINKTMGFI